MLLKKIEYFEHKGQPNFWEIKDVIFSKQNVIVGLNATGKTRLTNIITNLGKALSSKVRKSGNWEISLIKDEKTTYNYILSINNNIIEREKITNGKKILLDRQLETGQLYSVEDNGMHNYKPPKDELTINVRRDLAHYPFLEDIINWAKNINGYSFSGVKSDQLTVPSDPESFLSTLTTVPYILNELKSKKEVLSKIVDDMNSINYPIENISSKQITHPSTFSSLFLVTVKEKDLKCQTDQNIMSQGMFRAMCLIVILEYYLNLNKTGTIVIDDLGEGLDFDRANKLVTLLFEKTKNSDIQIIITSNDRFLINSVDLQNVNYLQREGHTVVATNYENNKELFEKFIISGLTNFDLLYSNINKN